jgi:hypothetical protein
MSLPKDNFLESSANNLHSIEVAASKSIEQSSPDHSLRDDILLSSIENNLDASIDGQDQIHLMLEPSMEVKTANNECK